MMNLVAILAAAKIGSFWEPMRIKWAPIRGHTQPSATRLDRVNKWHVSHAMYAKAIGSF